MSKAARHGDVGTGVCTAHPSPIPMTGTIIATASKTKVDNILVARMGDIVQGGCGHTGTINSCSGTATAEGKGIARMGDSFSGAFSGTITTGSGTTDVA